MVPSPLLLAAALAAAPPLGVKDVAELQATVQEVQAAQQEGASAARELTRLTGVQLTPLLGMTFLGMVDYFEAGPEARTQLPWTKRPVFWGPGILFMLFLFFGHRIPGIRHAFKQLKLVENQATGLLSLPIVAHGFSLATAGSFANGLARLGSAIVPTAYADGVVAATPHVSMGAGQAVAFVAALVMGVAVWLLGHTVNVLVVLSPVAPLDWLLKTFRFGALAFLGLSAKLSPTLGAVVATLYISVAILMAGWSFRLMIFGFICSTDVFLLRSMRTTVAATVPAFAAALPKVPARTYGHVSRSPSGLMFSYRPWLVLPKRTIALQTEALPFVGRALLGPVLIDAPSPNADRVLVRFAPRFRPHSAAIAAGLGGLEVRDVGVIRGFSAGLAWARRQWSSRVHSEPSVSVTPAL